MTSVIAQNVVILRRKLSLNQAELGDMIGYSQPQIGRWERGSVPGTDALAKLAELANTSIDAFVTRPLDEAEAGGSRLPNVEELTEMLTNVQAEMPAGLTFADWPRVAAAALLTRLEQFAADRDNPGGVRPTQATLHAPAVPFRAPTRQSSPE